ncbi:MAG TPA: zf-HC2 domain-containing protein [Pyrinomonadaceae bacterium]|nr:zf-HC2 domain-containing protein [Pyrinomonadaceae bacterium]
MTAVPDNSVCAGEEVVAYLDGELDARALARFERHLQGCPRCAQALEAEKLLSRELDSALATAPAFELPKNFAQVVAARAQSDVSGVRRPAERRRALRLCAVLVVIACALTGGAALTEAVLAPLRAVWKLGATLAGFLGHALYDAGAGLTVISRGVGGRLLFGSRAGGVLVLLLLALALLMLRHLIAGYHRARALE